MIDLNRYYIAKTYEGVSGSYNGRAGFVPQASTGDNGKFLRADGIWSDVNLNSYATVTNLNLTGSNLQNQINNLNNTYATDAELSGVNNTLNTKINSLSGAAVLLYGNQTIDGTKTFRNSVYIHDLYVTGTEFIANVQNNFIESPYILLNLTGGAVDGGIFFVTGTGLTGINDYGPIIGFDHTDKFKFGIARRSDDLSVLNDIAAVQDITNYSGFANNNFYLKSNPSGFITGVEKQTKLFDYVTGVPIYMYVGSAPLGSSQNDNIWEIYRTEIDQNGLISSNLLAENATWTGRYFENYM